MRLCLSPKAGLLFLAVKALNSSSSVFLNDIANPVCVGSPTSFPWNLSSASVWNKDCTLSLTKADIVTPTKLR